jgi:hypothetical protein
METKLQRIDLTDNVYNIFFAIDKICFDQMFQFIPFYWIPEHKAEQFHRTMAFFKSNKIFLNPKFYDKMSHEEHINLVFHEMVHGFCVWKKIQDVESKENETKYHTKDYAKACKDHGGICSWASEEYGFTNAQLTFATMEKVKARIKELKGQKIRYE